MSSRGRSVSPRPLRDEDVDMDRGSRSPLRKQNAKVVVVTNLTRNVVESHLRAVFGFYGELVKVQVPIYGKSGQNKGTASLEYADSSSAHKAVSHMDGGQLDGAVLKCELSEVSILLLSLPLTFKVSAASPSRWHSSWLRTALQRQLSPRPRGPPTSPAAPSPPLSLAFSVPPKTWGGTPRPKEALPKLRTRWDRTSCSVQKLLGRFEPLAQPLSHSSLSFTLARPVTVSLVLLVLWLLSQCHAFPLAQPCQTELQPGRHPRQQVQIPERLSRRMPAAKSTV
ncbi:hypothetical protein BC628DRAFT_1414638 [Trametes gibbosa]|nr:hypothetical protein BC628DRAFT_1414638 [Trametes gibbosa]